MGTKLSQAPLFYTLGQVKFNPITQMSTYASRIQERLRGRYPDYQPEIQLSMSLSGPEGAISRQQSTRWHFYNADKTQGYVLYEDALVYHATSYDTSTAFLGALLDGLALVHEVVELAYIDRIGLRYLDAVAPGDQEQLEDYLVPELMGLSGRVSGKLIQGLSESLFHVDGATLMARIVITERGLALPPELHPMHMTLLPRFTGLTGKLAILDTDCFQEAQRLSFDLKAVESRLKQLKTHQKTVFNLSVTDHALERWK